MKSVKCSECGFVGWADSERCKKCGVIRLSNPAGDYAPAPTSYEESPIYYQSSTNGPLKKGMAVTSLVLGILGFFTFGIMGIGAVVGIVLASSAMRKARQLPSEYGGQGVATAGLVMNVTSLVMVVPIGLVAAIAIPNLLASRRAANEGASIAALRRIHDAQRTYYSTVGGESSFGTMDQLMSNGLVDPQLATGVRSGYRFKVEVRPSTETTYAAFRAVGVPVTYGKSGIRSFYIDESGVIRGGDNRGADATEEDPPLNFRY